ncbi:MAG: type I restriction enzyme HsdR N-terminal domain-containing protein [Planctomycetota bacterium]|jgi:predicted type IV restriction endonuclease
MAKITKKTLGYFSDGVSKFQKVLKIANDRDINESDTVDILTDIMGEVFGYDKYLEITSEYAIRSRYCDLAVKIDNKVEFLIEVKAIGVDLKENHIRQAVDYAANLGVNWVVLTNAREWQIYRLRFEKPINYDLVHTIDFLGVNPKSEKDQDSLFLISREGLMKNARDDFYEKIKTVNSYTISNLLLTEDVIKSLVKELRKLSDGVKVDPHDVEMILKQEVLRRSLVEGEEAEAAQQKFNKLYKKSGSKNKRTTVTRKEKVQEKTEVESEKQMSVTEQLLAEAGQQDVSYEK